jgi:hypothetical protein
MEIVYYPYPVPTNRYTITVLGILFDRVLLPGLYMPNKVDNKLLRDEFSRISSIDETRGHTPESLIYLSCLRFLEEYQSLKDVFVPTGKEGYMGIVEEETQKVAEELEQVIYGPPPANFTPTITDGFNFGLGSGQINGPSWITYPANAYVVANKSNLPLFSDKQEFPFPSNMPHNANAELLASYLAISSLMLVMPRIKPLKAEQIFDVRNKLKEQISDLHTVTLSMTDKLRQLVGEEPSLDKLGREANYLAQTFVKPKIETLTKRIETPGEIIKGELIDFTIEAPELLWRIKINPSIENWLDLLKLSLQKLKSGVDRYRKANEIENQSGLSLLLKLPKKYKK